MSKPFDYVNEINFGKNDIMRNTANDDLAEKSHNQFLTNRSLSYFADTVLFANEMNTRELDNRLHFTYLLHAVRQKRRFSKWAKAEDNDIVNLIAKYFNYSTKKAYAVRALLSDEQIENIKQYYYEGGKNV